MDANSIKVMEESVKKTVPETKEEPLAGTKEAAERSTEMPNDTNPENKAETMLRDLDVELITGTSKNEKLSTVSKNKRGPTNLKRRRLHFQKICVQENEDSSNKKLKTHAKEEALDGMQLKYVQGLVDQKVQGMTKMVINPGFIQKALHEMEKKSRRELVDLVIQKMLDQTNSKAKFEYIRTQLVNSENTLATYRRKVAEMSQQFDELDTMRAKRSSQFTRFSAGQSVTVDAKSEPHAAGNNLQLKYVQRLVDLKVQGMPKTELKSEFTEDARSMSRRELVDLAIQKMLDAQKAKYQFEYIRTLWLNSENTLATYCRKIAEMSKQFHELDTMGDKTPSDLTLSSASQNATVAVKREPQAADNIPSQARPPNEPKPVVEL